MTDPQQSREEFASEFDFDVNPLEKYEENFRRVDSDPFEFFKREIVEEKDKENTRRNYLVPIKQWREFFEERDGHPACPGDADVEDFLRYQLEERGNQKDGTEQKIIHLNRMFKFWIEEDTLPHGENHNPFRKVLNNKDWSTSQAKKPPNPSLEELRDVLSTVMHWKHFAIILTQLFHGARAQEVCNIELREVNLTHDDLKDSYPELGTHPHLPNQTDAIYFPSRDEREGNKSMEPRILPIPDELRTALIRYLMIRPDNGSPWLFLSKTRHNQLGNSKVNEIWKQHFHPEYEADENDRFRSITSHFGRHYFTTWFKKSGSGNANTSSTYEVTSSPVMMGIPLMTIYTRTSRTSKTAISKKFTNSTSTDCSGRQNVPFFARLAARDAPMPGGGHHRR